jgi:hypothetical protein
MRWIDLVVYRLALCVFHLRQGYGGQRALCVCRFVLCVFDSLNFELETLNSKLRTLNSKL